jgi:hypothetical protein
MVCMEVIFFLLVEKQRKPANNELETMFSLISAS